ncbi:MAG TPA: polysaccharide deacetylase family protein [Thermoanaerobaculia bacterium]|jgi:peptidoglycan/xylan/chitin deacetylase (PgdA/CDA1 family)
MRAWIVSLSLLFCTSGLYGSPFELAVTFDDLPMPTALREPLRRQQSVTRQLTLTLAARRIPAVGFVNVNKLLVNGRLDPKRLELLRMWLYAGAELGNHTFSHLDLHHITLSEFEEEVVRGEEGLRDLVERRGQRLRWFRHPFLHTGTSAEVRERSERFLQERGYRVAPVTIDNADWIFARAYDVAASVRDAEAMKRIRADYVQYMLAKTDYFRAQARQLFGREIPHILLVHANGINADAFGELADALVAEGARFVTLESALTDDAYRTADTWYGRGGISWVHRWSLSAGVKRERRAGEPVTPPYILRLANVDSE